MGIVWGAEGAQEREVLLELGQGRAGGESPLVLACIFVLRSHGHHLRGMERARERGPPDRERVAEPYWLPHHVPRRGAWAGPNGPGKDLMLVVPTVPGPRAERRVWAMPDGILLSAWTAEALAADTRRETRAR